ncbi:MAG: hypothetical protein WCO25_02010 [Candidatus Uhrbacteria bacterium]
MKSLFVLVATLALLGAGCSSTVTTTTQTNQDKAAVTDSLNYVNAQYGFSLTLPESWQGYTITTDIWQGNKANPPGSAASESTVETGTTITINNPKADTTGQRIPVMVIPLNQWADIDTGIVSTSAAPFSPNELGRNTAYVFALPPRYDYGFDTPEHMAEAVTFLKSFKTVNL